MSSAAWSYFLFTFSLVVVFVCIIVYYYNPRRKKEIEAPKHRMLKDDEVKQVRKRKGGFHE